MENTDVIKLDGQLAFLKPRSTEWQPLSIKSLLPLKSLQLPNLLFFAGSGTSLNEVHGPSR